VAKPPASVRCAKQKKRNRVNWRTDIYNELVGRLRAGVPELAWIDVQRGQLSKPKGEHPVPFPAVLVEFTNVSFEGYARGLRKGTGTLKLWYATDAVADMHEGSETLDYALAEFEMIDTLTRVVAFAEGANNLGDVLDKTGERVVIQNGDMVVWELSFGINVVEDHRMVNNEQLIVNIE